MLPNLDTQEIKWKSPSLLLTEGTRIKSPSLSLMERQLNMNAPKKGPWRWCYQHKETQHSDIFSDFGSLTFGSTMAGKGFDLAASCCMILLLMVGSKPYILNVNGLQRMTKQETMMNMIQSLFKVVDCHHSRQQNSYGIMDWTPIISFTNWLVLQQGYYYQVYKVVPLEKRWLIKWPDCFWIL